MRYPKHINDVLWEAGVYGNKLHSRTDYEDRGCDKNVLNAYAYDEREAKAKFDAAVLEYCRKEGLKP